MFFKSFCVIVTLQSGVAILASCFMFIPFLILTSNSAFEISAIPNGLIFLVIFSLLMFVTGLVMFTAAYKESQKLCLVAAGLIVLTIVLFVIGSGLSFANSQSLAEYVCVEERCTESFWLATWRYRECNNEATVKEIRAEIRWHGAVMGDGTRRRLRRENQNTVETDQNAVENDNKPSETDQNAVENDKRPGETDQNTVENDKEPGGTDQNAVENEKKPGETDQNAVENEEKLGETDQNSKDPSDQNPEKIITSTSLTKDPSDDFDSSTEKNPSGSRESSDCNMFLIAAIVLFLINFIFLVISALVVMSYHKVIPHIIRFYDVK